MNHRQWKKNYKKQHGFNPGTFTDKKKKAKLVRKIEKFLDARNFRTLGKALSVGLTLGSARALRIIRDNFLINKEG